MEKRRKEFVAKTGKLEKEVHELNEFLKEKEELEKNYSITETCTPLLSIACC